MKKIGKYILVFIVYTFLLIIGYWAGSGIKDEWDQMIKWAKNQKK